MRTRYLVTHGWFQSHHVSRECLNGSPTNLHSYRFYTRWSFYSTQDIVLSLWKWLYNVSCWSGGRSFRKNSPCDAIRVIFNLGPQLSDVKSIAPFETSLQLDWLFRIRLPVLLQFQKKNSPKLSLKSLQTLCKCNIKFVDYPLKVNCWILPYISHNCLIW